MDPRTKKIITGGAVATLAIAVIVINLFYQRRKGVEVQVETIERRDLTAVVSASGRIQPKRLVNISADTIGKVTRLAVEEGELVKAKEFTKGRILLRMEDTIANAGWFGQQEVTDQPVLTVDQVVENLDAVTAADVQALAPKLFQEQSLHLAVIGPFKDDGEFSTRLAM